MKKQIVSTVFALSLAAPAVQAQESSVAAPDLSALSRVAPALSNYTQDALFDTLWQQDDLSARDRGLITVAALVTRHDTEDLGTYVNVALDAGVTPAEISETITHLAFYTGWSNATAASEVIAPIYEERGIEVSELPAVDPELLPLNQEAEDARQTFVQDTFGDVSQGVVDNTEQLLFLDLWLRPALAPRDRSLVTVAALIAASKVEQMPFHLNKAMDNGLSKDEASAVLSHLAFYAGWPNIFSAMPVAKDVFESRAN
ncbi:4-carboxymuconolactone decarboxylase [Thalassospira sp. HJ]|uniref:carboxymuconolactone decarboxylase family protein n=1 Tax=Thalassospira sp. HJ TaxID=1616823 RepID=UPI0005CE3D1B|nr:carboxymuconolactone decarboxylase family protein [Thalassospira sp. HJ]KJE36187.1 4-carboxymuconolactone decarboxylase [Thalassospira sp. HJ]